MLSRTLWLDIRRLPITADYDIMASGTLNIWRPGDSAFNIRRCPGAPWTLALTAFVEGMPCERVFGCDPPFVSPTKKPGQQKGGRLSTI